MQDDLLLRYSRHIMLPQIEYAGQEKLTQSHALIIGAGGLGAPVAMYLAAAGVGTLTICDFDVVDLTNLQRQIIHTTAAVGQNKALSAQATIAGLNPEISVNVETARLNAEALAERVATADVVIDCSDNFATRYLLNQLCFDHKTPLVSGAAIRFEGQLSVFDFRHAGSPCYHCLYPDVGDDQELRCADNGVFAPLVGMIGTAQAGEAIKLLLNIGQTMQGRLLLLNALSAEWRTIRLKKDPSCTVCGH
ncbi:Molybdopterin or thiamine biosynthesis adenylyltransferase [Methylophilus rhizosphaerae]|uniref:Molybdopterin-synthase adenylyltransferase n=1 Tax=Methylophilus rhizosphaerae TaxID=492660 RepID=A0A1G9E1J2_9PROT|nr:molybdopterin-synthase adenylyltransferase MoeB [Methylophilus rhizosphaerae]SDK70026.1 Molybdopterin or thiamine biosynthesis adenylyltransferase [Methylophilus rhizosphaerae]